MSTIYQTSEQAIRPLLEKTECNISNTGVVPQTFARNYPHWRYSAESNIDVRKTNYHTFIVEIDFKNIHCFYCSSKCVIKQISNQINRIPVIYQGFLLRLFSSINLQKRADQSLQLAESTKILAVLSTASLCTCTIIKIAISLVKRISDSVSNSL